MFEAVHSRGGYSWLTVGFGDAKVESSESLINTGNIYTRLQSCMVDCKTLNYFHVGWGLKVEG